MKNYNALESLGRERLSQSFFMRDFLYSEIANWHRMRNVPDFPDHALRNGRRLCTELLEPLQARFGRIHVRSGYRSPEVNAFGNENKLNCASNERNFSAHIWDYPDSTGHYGATACIVIPVLADYIAQGGTWTAMAWWIHDHLGYGSMCSFAQLGAFNLGWHENPARRIDSYAAPAGCLVKPGMPSGAGSHVVEYAHFLAFVDARTDLHAHAFAPETVRDEGRRNLAPRSDTNETANNASERPIHYRAVHTKTAWRRARHATLDNALFGKDGAAALFAGKARIDYDLHGQALYVITWQDGEAFGKIARPDPAHPAGIETADIPAAAIGIMERNRGDELDTLAGWFSSARGGLA